MPQPTPIALETFVRNDRGSYVALNAQRVREWALKADRRDLIERLDCPACGATAGNPCACEARRHR